MRGRQLFAAASAAGKLLVEAFMYRSHPQTKAVLAAIAKGDIGRCGTFAPASAI